MIIATLAVAATAASRHLLTIPGTMDDDRVVVVAGKRLADPELVLVDGTVDLTVDELASQGRTRVVLLDEEAADALSALADEEALYVASSIGDRPRDVLLWVWRPDIRGLVRLDGGPDLGTDTPATLLALPWPNARRQVTDEILADLDRPATFVAAEGEWTLDVVEGLMNHRWDVVRDDLRPHVLAALHEHADLEGDVLLALQAPNERRPFVWLWRPDDDLVFRVD